MKVNVNQLGHGFQLSSSNGSEEIYIGVNKEYQEDTQGLRPMELLLSSLGACLSIDILNFSKKMRLGIEDLKIEVDGIRDEEPPKAFTAIDINIAFKGDVKSEKIVQTIKKVIDQYCSVFHSLDKAIKINVFVHVDKHLIKVD